MRLYVCMYICIYHKKNLFGAQRGEISSSKELMALLPSVWRKKEGSPERGELGEVTLELFLES